MKKYNMIRHIKGCHLKNKRKDTVTQNKKCNFCGAEFVKKSNQDQHIKNIHGDEPAAALLSQKENNNEGTVSSQGNANNCEEDANIFGSNVLPTFIAFPNEGSDEGIESGGERDEGPSNRNEEGKESDNESQREDNLEERGNVDTASSSFSQEHMMQNIVAELKLLHSQRTQKLDDIFITKIAAKLSTDMRCRKSQQCAAQFIVERLQIWLMINHLYHGQRRN